jgi:ribosomal-protein-alanine N-acetyltransferase
MFPELVFPDVVPVLHTARLMLRPLGLDDVADYQKLRSHPLAMRHLDRPRTETMEQARVHLLSGLTLFAEKTGLQWGIFLQGKPSLIGTIGFYRLDAANLKSEIGYMLLPDFWRQGLGTEAMQAVMHFGFAEMKLNRIEADINPDNAASIALCKKLGFLQEAHIRQNFRFEGRMLDTVLMGILRSDWLQTGTK